MQRDRYGLSECNSVTQRDDSGRRFFELGMSYMTGTDVPVDLVSAHKWFNLAAMSGYGDANRLRREIADEMTTAEITTAQRAARHWITTH
jgi:TPR repeat protein